MLERLFLMVAPASAVVGAAAFVVSTVYLAFERCSSCTGFLEGMNRTPALSLTRQVIIGVMIYRVLDCIADMPPAQPAEIPARNCDDLRVSWDGYSGPERLTAADSAWRWSYTKYETGFQVAVLSGRDVGLDDAAICVGSDRSNDGAAGQWPSRRLYPPSVST